MLTAIPVQTSIDGRPALLQSIRAHEGYLGLRKVKHKIFYRRTRREREAEEASEQSGAAAPPNAPPPPPAPPCPELKVPEMTKAELAASTTGRSELLSAIRKHRGVSILKHEADRQVSAPSKKMDLMADLSKTIASRGRPRGPIRPGRGVKR